MPALAEIVGFDNRWQAAAVPHAVERILPSGAGIRASLPPYLVAMNWRPFRGRGRGDFIDSRDFEDISVLLDRRNELVDELAEAGDDVAVTWLLRPASYSMSRGCSTASQQRWLPTLRANDVPAT